MEFLALLTQRVVSLCDRLGAVTTEKPVTCPGFTFLPDSLQEQGPGNNLSPPTLVCPVLAMCSACGQGYREGIKLSHSQAKIPVTE